jgi:hypothetical protein
MDKFHHIIEKKVKAKEPIKSFTKDDVENMLIEWGYWSRYENTPNLNYHSHNIISRMIEGDFYDDSHSKFFPKKENENPKAEIIEYLVRKLSHYSLLDAKILQKKYIGKYSQKNTAEKMKISVSQLKVHIVEAKAWLAGYLSSIDAEHKEKYIETTNT